MKEKCIYSGAQNKRDGLQKVDGFCQIVPEPLVLRTATKVHSGTSGSPCFAFWSVQPKPLKLGSMLIPHFKALICGYLLVKRSKG